MKDSTTIHDWHALVPFGIHCLTSESDAYGRRLLCDLSEEGVKLISDYLGLVQPATITRRLPFAENWNSQVGEAKAVACVLLSPVLFRDLATFALLHVGDYDYVVESPCQLTGLRADDPLAERYLVHAQELHLTIHYNERKRRVAAGTAVGDRNVHQFTGRVL